jgi:hypothetical protein
MNQYTHLPATSLSRAAPAPLDAGITDPSQRIGVGCSPPRFTAVPRRRPGLGHRVERRNAM